MASPQIENGYTTIANEILDHLYKQPLNGTELKVVMCILRYTFGLRMWVVCSIYNEPVYRVVVPVCA